MSIRRKRTLAALFQQSDDLDKVLYQVLLVIVGSTLLTVSAKLHIPFWPVPITLQTLVVLLVADVFGFWLGIATVIIYLAEGAIGWPVFANGSGLDYFTGPSGGFLVGFVVSAALVGHLAERGYDRRWRTALIVFLAGDVVLFAFGIAWLTYLFGATRAIWMGLIPFAFAEAIKILLAMALLPYAWKIAGSRY